MAISIKRKNILPRTLLWKAFQQSWIQFSHSTAIHGIRYITGPDVQPFARVIWTIVFLASFFCANVFIFRFYLDFISNPTRMNIDTDHAPLSGLLFPGVTICSANYISYVKIQAFVKTLDLPSNISQETVTEYITQVRGFRKKIDYNRDELQKLQEIADFNRYSTEQFMSHLRESCDELLFRCRWNMETADCRSFFQTSLTYSGSCCSFNINQTGIKFLKKYAVAHGFAGGISVIVRPLTDNLAYSSVYSNGFKLIIHKNEAFPNENSIEKMISETTENYISVTPKITSCSDQVKNLNIDDRDCLFPDEKQLKYFSSYDDENCDFECQILSIVNRCQCIPYFFFKDPRVPTCNFTKIPCLVDNYGLITIQRGSSRYRCDCPSRCQDIDFDVRSNSIPLSINNFTVDPFYDGIQESDSIVHVFMISQTFRRMRRDLLTNPIGLTSNLGSTYSLFLGMSLTSVLEVIYFFTAVLRRNYIKLRDKNKKFASYKRRLHRPSEFLATKEQIFKILPPQQQLKIGKHKFLW